MLYCPECGTANPEQGVFCTECGTELPQPITSQTSRSITSRSSTSAPQSQSQGESWWQRLGPDWRASIIFWAGFLILSTITGFTGGTGCAITFPLKIGIPLAQGAVVGRLASQDDRYDTDDYFGLGLRSGLWSFLITLAFEVLAFAILVGVSIGYALTLLPAVLLSLLGSIVLTITLTGLGAWLYGQYGGKKLIGILVGVGCGTTIIVGILIAILIAILGSLGISLLQ